ncbi:ABC-2 transporter permease [Paenibacillus sp. EC2-1]|uniref:ABC-2 transporter permease n=1 Tax=Paenibacillus sp. EC2-1 TaxID=3388665 RepID=UPI003BEF2438
MLNLLRKDFIALKSSLWMVFLYLGIFSITFIPKSELSIYFVGIYTAFGSITLITMNDIKNNNHHFLVTLPVSRKQIVQAKFLTAIIITLFGVFASYGIHWVAKIVYPQFSKPDYSILAILVPIAIVLLLTSIYMPLFYALSKKGAGIINAVFLVAIITMSQPVAVAISVINQKDVLQDQSMLFIPLGIILIFIASYFLTMSLFSKKDI